MNGSTFSVSDSIKAAWAKVHGAKSSFWAVFLIMILLQLIITCADNFTKEATSPWVLGIAFIVIVALNIILKMLDWGVTYLGILRAKEAPIRYNMVSYALNLGLLLRMIGLVILWVLILVPSSILIALPSLLNLDSMGISGTLLSILLVAFGIVLGLFLVMRMYISSAITIAERAYPWTAIQQSFEATRHHVWQLLGLTIINIGIFIISIIPLGIGLIWSLPYLYINYGEVYKKLNQ